MVCFAAVCLVTIGFFLLSQTLFRFSPQNLNEVIALVRCVDLRELEDFGSETIEENLRSAMSNVRFDDEQRKRALLLFEYLRRMSFNSWVMLGWAQQEQEEIEPWKGTSAKPLASVQELVRAGIAFRMNALAALGRLFIRLLLMRLKIAPPPRLGCQLRVGTANLTLQYRELATAALKLAGTDSPDKLTRLAVGLFGIQNRS